jgi:hypothetical protein
MKLRLSPDSEVPEPLLEWRHVVSSGLSDCLGSKSSRVQLFDTKTVRPVNSVLISGAGCVNTVQLQQAAIILVALLRRSLSELTEEGISANVRNPRHAAAPSAVLLGPYRAFESAGSEKDLISPHWIPYSALSGLTLLVSVQNHASFASFVGGMNMLELVSDVLSRLLICASRSGRGDGEGPKVLASSNFGQLLLHVGNHSGRRPSQMLPWEGPESPLSPTDSAAATT